MEKERLQLLARVFVSEGSEYIQVDMLHHSISPCIARDINPFIHILNVLFRSAFLDLESTQIRLDHPFPLVPSLEGKDWAREAGKARNWH